MRNIFVLLAILTLNGCVAALPCDSECEGDSIVHCERRCPATADNDPADFAKCERIFTEVPCDEGKTCAYALASNSNPNGGGSPGCFDKPLEPCEFVEFGAGQCDGPNIKRCTNSIEGGLFDTRPCTNTLEGEAAECHPVGESFSCVRSPKQLCDQRSEPTCTEEGTFIQSCDGVGDELALIGYTCANGCVPGESSCSPF